MTQLRGCDIVERDGVHGLRITPDAGDVKGNKARVVPLHEDLIAQGFLTFVDQRGPGPLFYRPAKDENGEDPLSVRELPTVNMDTNCRKRPSTPIGRDHASHLG
jgi:hypothetical protein